MRSSPSYSHPRKATRLVHLRAILYHWTRRRTRRLQPGHPTALVATTRAFLVVGFCKIDSFLAIGRTFCADILPVAALPSYA
jgi:hypothetical protein